MKVLVIGANGFIGSNVCSVLGKYHDVYKAGRLIKQNDREFNMDLLDLKAISRVLLAVKPEVIINCAGVVENSDRAKLNVEFTENLLNAIAKNKLLLKRIIISGSAAEYGNVTTKNIPVAENTPLNADAGYGLSKILEENAAIKLGDKYNLPVTTIRIFNPIGNGMHPRFLIPSIIRQVAEFKVGTGKSIKVSRLDSLRDYINVKDIASAIKALIEHPSKYPCYNVGSGIATSNRQLIELIIKEYNLSSEPELIETSLDPEKLVAVQADITRIHEEFHWIPDYTIEETIKEIVNAPR